MALAGSGATVALFRSAKGRGERASLRNFQSMVALGRANSRMKDFYDIWILTRPLTSHRIGSREGDCGNILSPADRNSDGSARCAHTGICGRSPEVATMGSVVADIDHAPRQLALVVGDLAPFLMDAAAMAHRQPPL